MDNITHSLTGLALARAGFNRVCPHATLLMILAANVPDIDIVALQGGALKYLEWHRGYTHSLCCLPLMASLPVLFVAAIYRRRLPWLRAWLLCCAGVGSHVLMDWTNSYGVRLVLPFSSRWFYSDLNSLFDEWILAVLLFAAVWPLLSGLVSSEIGYPAPAGRGIAVFALAFFVLFDTGRAVLHQRAIAELNARLYDNAPPVTTAALPESSTPFRWTGIVETVNTYRLNAMNVLRDFDPERAEIFYKPSITPTLENAKQTEPFRYFLYFARFPVWSEEPIVMPGGPGKWVDLTDLRFGTPRAGNFHCIAIENNRSEIIRSWFTYGSGTDHE